MSASLSVISSFSILIWAIMLTSSCCVELICPIRLFFSLSKSFTLSSACESLLCVSDFSASTVCFLLAAATGTTCVAAMAKTKARHKNLFFILLNTSPSCIDYKCYTFVIISQYFFASCIYYHSFPAFSSVGPVFFKFLLQSEIFK